MSRAMVEVDLNSRDAQGLTPTRLSRSTAELHVGQIVTAVEREDGVQARAYVAEVDKRTGYAFLHIDMDSMTELNDVAFQIKTDVAVNRAVASVQNRAAALASTNSGATARASISF